MAYDPKDPADKKIVDGLIADAVAAAKEEAADEHETAVTGLKSKVTELRGKLAKAKSGEGSEGGDADKLEAEVERLSGELKAAKKELTTATKNLETVTGERDGLTKDLTSTLVSGGLTEALSSANVDPKFLPAVTAMLTPKVSIKTEADGRKAVVGDKSLGDFVKEWSQGDEGKSFIRAAGNSGGGAQGGSQGGQGGGKTMPRAEYDSLTATNPSAVSKFFAEGGTIAD